MDTYERQFGPECASPQEKASITQSKPEVQSCENSASDHVVIKVDRFSSEVSHTSNKPGIVAVGQSGYPIGYENSLKNVVEIVERVAPTEASVMITGESGTGKEIMANLIHSLSKRSEKPMIYVNSAALPDQLVESELFGHEKGAFTGAFKSQIGRFEAAHESTIFFDEIGELKLDLQPKLLRVLQESTFQRVGSNTTHKTNVRVIAATNDNLPQKIKKLRFREDLYYRLNVIPIHLPPLRERGSDIEKLFRYFAKKYSTSYQRSAPIISGSVLNQIRSYIWPGNVRELSNYVERSVITQSWAEIAHDQAESMLLDLKCQQTKPLLDLKTVERNHILRVLKHTNGVVNGKGGAAEILDLNPSTLRSRMQKLKIFRCKLWD